MDDVVVAILTGGRPALLEQTLGRLEQQCGDRLRRWHAVALVNGADRPTLDLIENRHWVSLEVLEGKVRAIGPAVSHLMDLVGAMRRRFVVHLEDDWGCMHPPAAWLDRAAHVLGDASVGQVRLRSEAEKVMHTAMHTGGRIKWEWAPDHGLSRNAHFTFNPSLVRTEDLSAIYPCKGELEAQHRFAATGKCIVQVLPGSFQHLGADDSLRRRLGRGH